MIRRPPPARRAFAIVLLVRRAAADATVDVAAGAQPGATGSKAPKMLPSVSLK
jgi:hypothetical protein